MNKIDIVYTYVNTTNNKWINKVKKYTNILNDARFNFNGEIYFSLLTIQKFFNWVNNIFIIHDNQTFPLDFLNNDFKKKIYFIDHKDIIPSQYLPTFNSMVIECFIWKIKNLSKYFLYLNDDMFFGNYIKYNDIFDKNNKMKLYAVIMKKGYNKNILNKAKYLISYNDSMNLFNSVYNTNLYIKYLHVSYNFNKYICEYTFLKFEKYIFNIFNYKFRRFDNNFSFILLCGLMHIFLNVSSCSYISSLIIQELNEDNYNLLIKNKPKIYCINQLYNNQKDIWIKLQNNYIKLFK